MDKVELDKESERKVRSMLEHMEINNIIVDYRFTTVTILLGNTIKMEMESNKFDLLFNVESKSFSIVHHEYTNLKHFPFRRIRELWNDEVVRLKLKYDNVGKLINKI